MGLVRSRSRPNVSCATSSCRGRYWALAGRETEADGLVDLLSAFRAGVRLTKGREGQSRAVLVHVLENSVTPLRARRRALQLLDGYRPWDADTAAAVQRFRAETSPK